MTTPIVICDDSSFARKQMARALPGGWDVEISFANHGEEAIEAIKAGKADILFLDLNMPVMDGYAVLEAIRKEDLPTMVLVVSGDIQPEAHKRVMALGALDFIKKPVTTEKITEILVQYGIISSSVPRTASELARFDEEVALTDLIQEVVNVSMGQAGSLLAGLLNTFIHLPVPKVHLKSYRDLKSVLASKDAISLSGVSQGFNGSGIAGEAILLVGDESFPHMTRLMQYDQMTSGGTSNNDLEVLMDLSGILIGACLKGIAEQLDIEFSYSHPVILGQKKALPPLLGTSAKDQKVLAIEIDYGIPDHQVECDLILVLTEDSLPALTERAGYLK
ncbi:response regulator [Oceanospirillum sanctuarii]|uniref:response regulator n=1 Tax=Oceanospirillum sanctuarii TaxID=1434821 RepID=UPI000A38BE9E|nr:response regulator [Oceanospirillum sanctuarii]